MIEQRQDKDRVKCPHCNRFLAEVKPRMSEGQSIVVFCPTCKEYVEIKK